MSNTNVIDTFNCTKHELENIEKQEANKYIFRSKSKYYEEGEKNTKYFMSLEKRNYTNKTIKQLEINNKIIHDQHSITLEEK